MEIRINKYLSSIGYCSRREADKLIIAKKVKVNDKIIDLGYVLKDGEKVLVNDKPINIENKKLYYKFYKPKGIVCTTAKFDKNNIIDFINIKDRIYPVGRLDKDSEGLILLTNDGSIVNPILKGSNNHEKEYIVTLNKNIQNSDISKMKKGVPILDTITRPCKIDKISSNILRFTITQGLNRQIRRMCEYVGYKVIKLERVRIINIGIGDLKEGELRELTKKELSLLKRKIGYNG